MKDRGIEITYNSFTDNVADFEVCPCCGTDLSKADYSKRNYIQVDSWLFGCFSTEYTFSKYHCKTCNSSWVSWSKGRTITHKYAKQTIIFTAVLAICVTLFVVYGIHNPWIYTTHESSPIVAVNAFIFVLLLVLTFTDLVAIVSNLNLKLFKTSPKKLIKDLEYFKK